MSIRMFVFPLRSKGEFKYSSLFLSLLLLSLLLSCIQAREKHSVLLKKTFQNKIAGLSFVSPVHPVDSSVLLPVKQLNAKWIALMPYAFSRSSDTLLYYNISRQWWGEKKEGVQECIRLAHTSGLKVMLKPHLWISRGSYTGHFDLQNEQQWVAWEKQYENYLLEFARLADAMQVELFCIGNELQNFVLKRPAFWKNLIQQVKKIYKGKLTYAANWDEYKHFPLWGQMDFIGINAYFPLSASFSPTADSLLKDWDRHLPGIQQIQKKWSKPVLFTEFGYRSMQQNTLEPWDSSKGKSLNLQAQCQAYEALFQKFLPLDWFAGGFLWKWFDQHSKAGGMEDTGFTPQNKPAEELIRQWFDRMEK